MKNVVFAVIIVLAVFCAGYVTCWLGDKPEITELSIKEAKAKYKDSIDVVRYNDSISCFKAGKESEKANTDRIRSEVYKLRSENGLIRIVNDTLMSRYKRSNDLKSCDSLVKSQLEEIVGLRAESNELDSEAQSYSKRLFLAERMIVFKDSVISNRDSANKRKDEYIDKLQCSREWAIRNRFLAWLVGYKCRNLK